VPFGVVVGLAYTTDWEFGGASQISDCSWASRETMEEEEAAPTWLIIGAAIAIPIAFGFIVVIIALVSVWLVIQRRASLANSRGAVSLGDSCTSDDQL
jgi:hypothetical protein